MDQKNNLIPGALKNQKKKNEYMNKMWTCMTIADCSSINKRICKLLYDILNTKQSNNWTINMSGSTTEKQYQKETITRTSSDASSYTVSTSDPVLMLENFPIENSIANGTALRCRPFVSNKTDSTHPLNDETLTFAKQIKMHIINPLDFWLNDKVQNVL